MLRSCSNLQKVNELLGHVTNSNGGWTLYGSLPNGYHKYEIHSVDDHLTKKVIATYDVCDDHMERGQHYLMNGIQVHRVYVLEDNTFVGWSLYAYTIEDQWTFTYSTEEPRMVGFNE